MADQTARFALPLIDPGQAQKEMTHNEALAAIDAALQPGVKGVGRDTPPAAPSLGDQWIVGAAPTDAWTGYPQAIAAWTAGGWRFVAAFEGMAAWSVADGLPLRFADGQWVMGDLAATRLLVGGVAVVGTQKGAIALPTGGTVIDTEARAAIDAIILALGAHGLIANT